MEVTQPLNKTLATLARPVGEALLPAERLWAQRQAEKILDEARQQAQRLLEKAKEQAALMQKEIRKRAAKELCQRYREALGALFQWRKRECSRLRQAALDVAFALAERLLNKELEVRPQEIANIVEGVLAESPLDSPLTVQVHPQALPYLQQAFSGRSFRFLASPELSPGDCVVRGDFGLVDGRIKVRLEVLRQSLERMSEDVFGHMQKENDIRATASADQLSQMRMA